MNQDQAYATVCAVLQEVAPEVQPADLDPGADLRSEADLDSMDFLNLVEGIAERTGVDVPESDYAVVRSLDGMTRYVAERGAG